MKGEDMNKHSRRESSEKRGMKGENANEESRRE
jgi:hypothetical protein